MENILEFYKKTSCYTDLGLYKGFILSLPNDIEELCMLQRKQIIHPIVYLDNHIREKIHSFWGDMRNVPKYRLDYEDDLFPTAQSMIAELLRRDSNYSLNRLNENKINITCRGEAILLAATLKAKNIPTRVRSGFANYLNNDGIYYDHWITEYYEDNRWKLVDADQHGGNLDFDLNNMPRDKFLFGAEAYLLLRQNKIKKEEIVYTSSPWTLGLKAAIRSMFYDFHSLMNDEILFSLLPEYIVNKDFKLTEEELNELDSLAILLLDPNNNFIKLKEIYDNTPKYRKMTGGLN